MMEETTGTLRVTYDAEGRTRIDPPLLCDADGDSCVRSITIKAGPWGEPCQVTAEILPREVLVEMRSVRLCLAEGEGGEIAEIVLTDGRRFRLAD